MFRSLFARDALENSLLLCYTVCRPVILTTKENPPGGVPADSYNLSQNDNIVKGVHLPARPRKQEPSGKFGARLKWIREQKQWSQTELAEKAGLTPAAISQIESDERQPSFNTLSRLAEAMSVSVGYLVGDEAELPAELQAFFRDLEKLNSSDVQQLKDFAAFLRNKGRQSSE